MHKVQSNPIQSMRWIVVLISSLLFFSCTKDETNASQTNPAEKLAYVIPEGYPSDVLDEKALENRFSFKIAQLQAVAAANKTTVNPAATYDLDKLIAIADLKKAKFPNLDALTAAEFTKLKKYFPKVTPENYLANEQTIRDYFDKLIANDLISEIPNIQDPPSIATRSTKGAYDTEYNGQKMNSEEFWFIVSHIRMKDGILTAKNLCEGTGALQDKKIPRLPTDNDDYGKQTKNDAMRHAILTAMIAKYGGRHYGSVDKAVRLAIEFTDLHEINTLKNYDVTLSHLMDKNNNRVGAEYFRSVGYTVVVESYGFGLVKNRDVRGPDDLVMLDALFNKGFKKGLYYSYTTPVFNFRKLIYLRETEPNEPILNDEDDWPLGVVRPTPAPLNPDLPPVCRTCNQQ
jgi:hypothetical protein